MQQQIFGGVFVILALGSVVFNRRLVAKTVRDLRIEGRSKIIFTRVVTCLVGAIFCYLGLSFAFQWSPTTPDDKMAATSFDEILIFGAWVPIAIWMVVVAAPAMLRARKARRNAEEPEP